MANVLPSSSQLDQMHQLYREGGASRGMAPHVIYQTAGCPHEGCNQALHAINFD